MKKNVNKGFSLVELIIVIAIMAVMIGVLAPQFIKYVEQSKRATDIQNAEVFARSIEADLAEGLTFDEVKDSPSGCPVKPTMKGDKGNASLSVRYDTTHNVVIAEISCDGNTYQVLPALDSASEKSAQSYKKAGK